MKHTLTALILFCNTLILYPQVILTIEGKEIIDTETGTSAGYYIPRNQVTTLTFRNNSLTSVNSAGYMLQAGDETTGLNNNHLDGAVITGNRFEWNGTDEESSTHVIFTGYNINVKIKYNYLKNPPNGIQRKSDGMTDLTGVVAYNIINNPKVGIVVKGMNGVRIFNNTLYCERTPAQTGRGLIDVHTNLDNGLNAPSTGARIYNNIFYTKYETLCINVMDQESLAGFESDYNVFYCETGSPRFNAGGSYKTFSEWQALGYDQHSVVINPNFNNFTDFVPAERLDYGTDLGENYIEGLAIDAVWSNVNPSTVVQNDKWQVGARIYEGKVIIEEPLDSVTLIYPNPARDFFYVLNNNPEKIFSTMKIYSAAGVVVLQQALGREINTVYLSGSFAAGLYNVVLEGDNLDSDLQKLIIVD